MDRLYNLNLFSQDFIIGRVPSKFILQTFVQVGEGQYMKILIFQALNNAQIVTLLALDDQNKMIGPISTDYLPDIINALKSIPFPDNLDIQLGEMSIDGIGQSEKPIFVKLSQCVSALVTSAPTTATKTDIKIELILGKQLEVAKFCFAAFDGINTHVHFDLLEEDLKSCPAWGILSKIRFYIDGQFAGDYYAQIATISSCNTISFWCQTKISSVLDRKMMVKTHIEGFNIFEISDFIVSSAGLLNCVSIPDDFLKAHKWYTLIVPVVGLELDSEFGLGCVEFCLPENEEIRRAISFENALRSFQTYALVHINSEKMYAAYEQGKRQIEQALDLLVNLIKDDSLLSGHSLGSKLIERNINRFENKVGVAPQVYIESPSAHAKFSFDYFERKDNTTLVAKKQLFPDRLILEKLELLLIKANGMQDEEITPLFNSLKWIRKAWDSADYEDQIISAVIALEFIISKETDAPLLDKSTRKECVRAIEKIIREKIGENEGFLETVIKKFHHSYTEPPFTNKLKSLIKRLNIPVSEEEMALIKSARDQRNSIIHGKNEILMPSDDVYRLCECISRIAFYKLYSLEV